MHTIPTVSGNSVSARLRRVFVHRIVGLFLIFGSRSDRLKDSLLTIMMRLRMVFPRGAVAEQRHDAI